MEKLLIQVDDTVMEVLDWDTDNEVRISIDADVYQCIYLKREDFEKLYSYIGHLMEIAPPHPLPAKLTGRESGKIIKG